MLTAGFLFSVLFLLPLFNVVANSAAAATTVDKRPNIILILIDDLGYGEVNAHDPKWAFPIDPLALDGGKPLVRKIGKNNINILSTPNLARFASESVRIPMSYAPAPICTPSRAGILLGVHVGAQYLETNLETEELVDYRGFVKDLRGAGYTTAYFGKWGLGFFRGGPWFHGFDRFVGQLGNVEAHCVFPHYITDYDSKRHAIPANPAQVDRLLRRNIPDNTIKRWGERNCPLSPDSKCVYVNDLIRDEAFDFIRKYANRSENEPPFFLYWSPTYPHAAMYNADDGYRGYRAAVKRMGRKIWTSDVMRGHAAQIEEHLDVDIGMFLDLMKSMPRVDENTLVIFTSDNGAHREPKKKYNYFLFSPSGGLRGMKYTAFEGGLRVPTMVRWRGRTKPGTINRVPCALYDLGNTFREVAGLGPSREFSSRISGSSMLQTWISGNETLAPTREWINAEYCAFTKKKVRVCYSATYDISRWREGEIWKFIIRNKIKEVYEIVSDPTERKPIKNKALIHKMNSLRTSLRVKE